MCCESFRERERERVRAHVHVLKRSAYFKGFYKMYPMEKMLQKGLYKLSSVGSVM
jgi:hypothetical protein